MNGKKTVALIGMMGTFKSSAGLLLAKRTGRAFADTDELVERTEGRTVSDIFAAEGEEYFRRCETEALRQAVRRPGLVLACGGGTPLREENARLLRENCIVVLLKAAPGVILSRIGNASARPLLKNNATVEAVAQLVRRRMPVYESVAGFTVDDSLMTSAQTADQIVKILEKNVNPG